MAYLIFFLSLAAIFLMTRIEPMRDWSRCLRIKPGISILLLIAFAVTFLGGVQETASEEVAVPGGMRLARFLVLVVLFLLIATKLMGRLTAFRHAGSATKFMLLYAVIAMWSASYSVSPLISLWKGFEVFVLVLVGIYIASELKQWEDLRWLNNILMLLMLFFVLSALLGVVLAPGEAFAKLELSSAIVVRGLAPPLNSNSLTQFSALLVVMALAFALNADKNRGKLGIWVVILLAGAVMLLGHSRTSIFSGILAAGGVLYFGRHRFIALLAAAGGVIALTLTEVVLQYIYRGQSQEVFISMSGRTYFWELIWKVFIDSPILGHGFYAAQRTLMSVSSVDNTYLEVLLGIGLVGLVAFVIPIIIVAVQLLLSIPKKTRPKREKMLWLQLMGLFVLLFVRSLTGPSFQVMHPNLVMFMMLLIGVQAYRRLKSGPLDMKEDLDKNVARVQTGRESGRVLQHKTHNL